MKPALPVFVLALTIGAVNDAAAQDAAQGAKDFAARCAPCHGLDAKGDGPAAASLVKKPANLTTISKRYGGTYPAGRVFETIEGLDMPNAHGSREMPVWGDVFLSEDIGDSTKLEDAVKATDHASKRILALVRYIETIQEKP